MNTSVPLIGSSYNPCVLFLLFFFSTSWNLCEGNLFDMNISVALSFYIQFLRNNHEVNEDLLSLAQTRSRAFY